MSNKMINTITQGDCLEVMERIPDGTVDLTVTSPPYDNLRTYNGFEWDFEGIAKELYRVTKEGGVVVWVVGDATVNGSETLTSFKQAIYFKEIGFNVHDTMIYRKNNPMPYKHNRYLPCFEYMFVFSKGKPKTFNPILVDTVNPKGKLTTSQRDRDGLKRKGSGYGNRRNKTRYRYNVWEYNVGKNQTTKDDIAFEHPAIFPEKLAEDHILTWSNPSDIILDPFIGSGTTAKMAVLNDRKYVGIDISEEYVDITRRRVDKALAVKNEKESDIIDEK